MADSLTGKQIGGYEILDVIGRGGMATVYRAQQVSMNRVVALKVLPRQFLDNDIYLQRFEREVKIVSQLEHRNIVPVYDYGLHEEQPYIVMRYMPAGSVDDQLRKGSLDIKTLVSIVEQIAPALDYAHGKSVLHRDLKPSNVLLDDGGGAYLTDFGIARDIAEKGGTITTEGVVGTPAYMSPEQAQGFQLDGRSDIYSLGIMLFEMATGRRPFEGDTPYNIAYKQVTTPPPSPRRYKPEIPQAIEQVIYKALEKLPDRRYANGGELIEALRRALDTPRNLQATQPNIVAQDPTPTTPVPIQKATQPNYTPPPTPLQAAPSQQSVAAQSPARKRRSSNVMFNVALGGIIGCGLLTLLVIVVAVLLNNGDSEAAEASPTGDEVGLAVSSTPTESAPVTLTESQPVEPGLTPVGVRATLALNVAPGSANNALVYFAERDGNFDLFRLDLGNGSDTRLTFDAAADTNPSVSPDGRQIAFQSHRDGDYDIYLMNIDGDDVRRLTDNNITDRQPSWSPDGEWIVFASDPRNDGNFDLFQIRPDGSDLRLILSNGQRNSQPRWSENGRYLLFTGGNSNDAQTWEVGRYDLETQSLMYLTSNEQKDWSPSFSPDTRRVLFLKPGAGDAAIASMTLDGSSTRTLYDSPGYDWGASFSPDGEFIVFTSDESGREELYLMTVESEDVQQLTDQGGMAASWVPGS